MVYFKHAYRPTSPHSPNQQIHAYKNSNVNKIFVPDIRFFSAVEIWPLPASEIGSNGRGEQGVLRAM